MKTGATIILLLVSSISLFGQAIPRAAPAKALSWSASSEGPLFVLKETAKAKDGLIYDDGKFSLRLSDSLIYHSASDSFSFWLGTDVGELFVGLERSGGGAYRTRRNALPEFGLNDFGKLKLLWVSSGERFLFTEIGEAWRCVSIEAGGRKLSIDYDHNGTIALVRDGKRSLEPVYKAGRLESVYQTWVGAEGKVSSTSLMR